MSKSTTTTTRKPATHQPATVASLAAGHRLGDDDVFRRGLQMAIDTLGGGVDPVTAHAVGLAFRVGHFDALDRLRESVRAEVAAEPMIQPLDADDLRASAILGERARIKAILDLPEAADRATSALRLALTTDIPPDAMAAVLAGLPSETLEAPPAWPRGPRSHEAPGGLATFDPKADLETAYGKQGAATRRQGAWSRAVAGANARQEGSS